MNVDWAAIFSSEATVIGVLLVVLISIIVGLLVPFRYVRGVERRLAHQEETNQKLTTAVQTLADWTETQNEVGETVTRTMSTLQEREEQ